jgi:gamma-glutamylcyclotransferase (GGCT)/AIG2-like uncharacterized protein YtfP
VNNTTFNLFVYGSLKSGGSAAHMMRDCELIAHTAVGGILYDIDGEYTTLVLYGTEPVSGEVWRCPWPLLATLDEYENVNSGLFRRVATSARRENTSIPCWVYVAGPKLAHKLTPERRVLKAASTPEQTLSVPGAASTRRRRDVRSLRRKDLS